MKIRMSERIFKLLLMYYLLIFEFVELIIDIISFIVITGRVGRRKLTCCSFQHSRCDPTRWRYPQRWWSNHSHRSSMPVRLCDYGFPAINGTRVLVWNPGMSPLWCTLFKMWIHRNRKGRSLCVLSCIKVLNSWVEWLYIFVLLRMGNINNGP